VIDHINSDITELIRAAGNNGKPKVKIAVLDTGCRTDGAWFNTWTDEAGRISNAEHWHDFAGEEPLPVDVDGHGTAVVSALLRTARNAEVFVGRVAATRADISDSVKMVVSVKNIVAVSWYFSNAQSLIY
jgi:hypothetical protein